MSSVGPMRRRPPGRIPLTVIGGYLGAGKTTVLNRLLGDPGGRRIGVIVNDFGSVGIDAEWLARDRDGGIVNLPNGCACCTLGDDLYQSLGRLVADGDIDHVVVEASGVADPAAVAAWSTVAPFEPGGVIVLAAVDSVRDLATDRYVGGEVVRQLAGADLIVMTKLDRCGGSSIEAVEAWLDRVAPGIPRVSAVHGDLPTDVLLGIAPVLAPGGDRAVDGGRCAEPDPMQHLDRYETWAWNTDRPIDGDGLTTFLEHLPAGVLRLKGWVVLGNGDTVDVNVVGRTREVKVRRTRVARGSVDRPGRHRPARHARSVRDRIDRATGVALQRRGDWRETAGRPRRCPTRRCRGSPSGRRSAGRRRASVRSAALPHSIVPNSPSRWSWWADPSVTARSAEVGRDPFVLTEHTTRRRDPVDGAPHRVQLTERGDVGVAVQRERHPLAFGGGGGLHAPRPLGSDGEVVVLVAPEPQVVGEDVGAHPEPGHPPVLGGGGELAVLHGVAMIEPRRFEDQLLDGVDPQVDRQVAVAVGVDVDPPLVERPADVEQLLGRHHPLAVIGARVVAGPSHLRGEPLDRAVEDHLQTGRPQLGGVAAPQLQHRLGGVGPVGGAGGQPGDVPLQDAGGEVDAVDRVVPALLRRRAA